MRAVFVTAVAVACATSGCDSRAKAADPGSGRAEKSREYETCASSAACADDLRCFEHACRRVQRSTVGDYFAAAGALAKSRGELETAIAHYAQALGHYDADKLALPADIDCAYGAALAAARSNKEHAELGARVLHRCLLAAPVGSRLRDQAFADLAVLGDAGLDPVLIGAGKLADRYLTRAPARPAADKITVSVQPNPVPKGKSFPQILDALAGAELRPALIACWEAYAAATRKDAVGVTIGVKSALVPSEYEDDPAAFAVKLEPPAGLAAGSPEAAADACVRAAIEPAIKGLKITDAFATRLAISLK